METEQEALEIEAPKQPRKTVKNRRVPNKRSSPEEGIEEGKQLSRSRSFLNRFRRNKPTVESKNESPQITEKPGSPSKRRKKLARILPKRTTSTRFFQSSSPSLVEIPPNSEPIPEKPISQPIKAKARPGSAIVNKKTHKPQKKRGKSIDHIPNDTVEEKNEKPISLEFMGQESSSSVHSESSPRLVEKKKPKSKFQLPLDELSKSANRIKHGGQLSDRSLSSRPLRYLKKSFTQREEKDEPVKTLPLSNRGVYNHNGLSSVERALEKAQKDFEAKNYRLAQSALRDVLVEFESIEKNGKIDSATNFSFACARFYYGECFCIQEKYLDAETQARECLHILDGFLLSEKAFLPRGKQVSSKYWLPGDLVSLEAVWLRKSATEDLLARALRGNNKTFVAAEWYQRACFSRERAGMPVNPTMSCNKCELLIEFVTSTIERSRLLLEVQKEIGVRVIERLDATQNLEEARRELMKALKECRGDSATQLEVNYALLNITLVLINLGELEVDLELKDSVHVASVNRRLDHKVQKIRKEIRRLERRNSRRLLRSTSKKLVATESKSENRYSFGYSRMPKVSLSDSRIEISLISPKEEPKL